MTEASPGPPPRSWRARLARGAGLGLVLAALVLGVQLAQPDVRGLFRHLDKVSLRDFFIGQFSLQTLAFLVGFLTGLLDRGSLRFVPRDPVRVAIRTAVAGAVLGVFGLAPFESLLITTGRSVLFQANKLAMWSLYAATPALLVAALEPRLAFRARPRWREPALALATLGGTLVALQIGNLQSIYASTLFYVSRESMLQKLGKQAFQVNARELPFAAAFMATVLLRRRGSSLAVQAIAAVLAAAASTLVLPNPLFFHPAAPSWDLDFAVFDACAVPLALELGNVFFKPDPPAPVEPPEPPAPEPPAS